MRSLVLVAVAFQLAAQPPEPKVQRLYVFGDSYSDTGAGYVDCDGPTAVAYLADHLGLHLVPSTQQTSAGQSLNFSVSGGQSGSCRRACGAACGRIAAEPAEKTKKGRPWAALFLLSS